MDIGSCIHPLTPSVQPNEYWCQYPLDPSITPNEYWVSIRLTLHTRECILVLICLAPASRNGYSVIIRLNPAYNRMDHSVSIRLNPCIHRIISVSIRLTPHTPVNWSVSADPCNTPINIGSVSGDPCIQPNEYWVISADPCIQPNG